MKTAIILAIFCSAASADELKLHDGSVINDWEVVRVLPDGLKVSHREGCVKIPMEDMPPQLAARFSFDPAKAKEFRELKAARNARPPLRLESGEPDRPPIRVLVAKYCRAGTGVKTRVNLSEAQIKELNGLLEKCPRGQYPKQEQYRLRQTVHFALAERWLECKDSGITFRIELAKDSFRWRVVPGELQPQVHGLFRKLEQHFDETKTSRSSGVTERDGKADPEKSASEQKPVDPNVVPGAAPVDQKVDQSPGWDEEWPDPSRAPDEKVWQSAEVQKAMPQLDRQIIRLEVTIDGSSKIESVDESSCRIFAGTASGPASKNEYIGFPVGQPALRTILNTSGRMTVLVCVEAENRWPYPQLFVVGRSFEKGSLFKRSSFNW